MKDLGRVVHESKAIYDALIDHERWLTRFTIIFGLAIMLQAVVGGYRWHTHDLLNVKVDFLLTESMKIHTHDEAGP